LTTFVDGHHLGVVDNLHVVLFELPQVKVVQQIRVGHDSLVGSGHHNLIQGGHPPDLLRMTETFQSQQQIGGFNFSGKRKLGEVKDSSTMGEPADARVGLMLGSK
jgi:hypothetical protein